MIISIRSLIFITIISIIKNGISSDNELIKQPDDIEIIIENSPIPNDTSKYQISVKDIKIFKYILNKDSKCKEVKQINKIENPIDPKSTISQQLTIWKYDRSKHEGRYPLSISYAKDDELIVDYGDESDIYVMFAGKWHFYGTGNIKTGKIITDKISSDITNKTIIIITSILVGILIIINIITISIISRLYKTINQVKLSVDRSETRKLLI